MSRYPTPRNRLLYGTFAGYRLFRQGIGDQLDVASHAVGAIVARQIFGPIVHWSLFALAFYVAVSEVDWGLVESRVERGFLTLSALGFALVWHAMYFRYTGPLPPTVEMSAFLLVAVASLSIGGFFLLTSNVVRSGVLSVVCFSLGLIAALLTGLSPVPELLVLGWVAWTVVDSMSPDQEGHRPTFQVVDLETRTLSGIVEAVRNEKGLYSLLIALTGLAISALFFLVFPAMYNVQFAESPPSEGWAAFFIVALLFSTYAAYGMWFWLRMIQRTNPFLLTWSGIEATTTRTRPVGLFVPPSLFIGGGFLLGEGSTGVGLVVLLVGLLATLLSVYLTFRVRPQPLWTDQYSIPIALVVQLIPLMFVGPPDVYVTAVVLPLLFFVPDVRASISADGERILTGLLVLVFVVLIWPPTVNGFLLLARLPAEMALIACVIYTFGRSGRSHDR